MNPLKLIPVSWRKALYAVAAAVNTLALAVVPILVSFNIVDATIANEILQIVAAVLAIASGLVAVSHISAPESN